MSYANNELGKLLKQQRINTPLTLLELAAASGVSASYLGRIERGERFPSAKILLKIAKPLGFSENELFTYAGFLTQQSTAEAKETTPIISHLDPFVAKLLAEEPPETQRAVIGILSLLKSVARGIPK